MAWSVHLPPPLLLLLLFPAASRESYKEKALCREVAGFTCGKLVPGASAKGQVPRVSFWDRPKAGHFVVSLARLTEEDSGYYWCSLLEVSSNTVLNSIKFYVAVSPAPTQAPGAARSPTSSNTQSSTLPTAGTTEALRAPSAFTPLAWPQNVTLCPDLADSCALGRGLCGLLLTKSLVLLALLWTLRSRCVQRRGDLLGNQPQPWELRAALSPQNLKQTPRVPQICTPRSCSLTSEPCSPAKTRPELCGSPSGQP
nr:natural cytotoxicity triggering receptor 2 isoform X2 [Cavia porcellus]